MNLLFDLGNSRCKWALADPALRPGGAFAYGDHFVRRLGQELQSLARPQRVLVSCVTHAERAAQLADWIREHWGLAAQMIVAQAQQCGVRNLYEPPERLGADRWAALLAARARQHGAVCVVDCGSAVTVDALDDQGVFRGGVILPGLAMQRAALQQGTAGIGASSASGVSCLSRNTGDAVAAGTRIGLAGAIDRIIECQVRALGQVPAVLITGGDANELHPLLQHPSIPVPELVLEGLAQIADETVPA